MWIPALGLANIRHEWYGFKTESKGTEIGEFTGYNTNINGEGYAKMTFKKKYCRHRIFSAWRTKAAATKDTLDMASYDKLAQPKTDREQREYSVADADLFGRDSRLVPCHTEIRKEHTCRATGYQY